ncbi:hypothetical protein C7974DRAFT_412919 [Boeremia exigua]|uniref:uncharacterized protein n=1 Tax=Boeremia exigua TaxID=749465 RepID=UPI001E8E8F31|nr:uncharacterized protein C7974DRAFT_412919 [Boeremia exigua]KAH6629094.1 hypothetical protein C7974DRAFT_412919 [Boeremia exigua]
MSDAKVVNQEPHLDPKLQKEAEVEEETEKPGRSIALFMLAYWLAWLVSVISKIFLSVRTQFFPRAWFIESPIVRYIFTQHIDHWPYGGFYILEPFYVKWSPLITTTFIVSSTACTMFQFMSIGRMMPFGTDLSAALTVLWMIGCLLGGSWVGLTQSESVIIALPFGWLSAKTVWLACLRKGCHPIRMSARRARTAFRVSMGMFSVVYVRILGTRTSMVAMVLIVEGGLAIRRWIRQCSNKQDMEKGDGDVVIGEKAV